MLKNYGDIYEYATFRDGGDYVVETGDIADELLQNTLKIGAAELVRKDGGPECSRRACRVAGRGSQ